VAVLSALILALAIALLWYRSKKKKLSLKTLPPAVRWQFEQFQENPSGWKKSGSGLTTYYSKLLEPKGEEWNHMKELFYGFQEADEGMEVLEAYAIYNPTLLTGFVNNKNILEERIKTNSLVFSKKDWLMKKNAEGKKKVYEMYEARAESIPWNKEEHVKIIPALHGTDYAIATSICSTGFAALSTTDGGWYGKGIYFTTFAMYSVPYFGTKSDPAVIISYTIIGNTYPVTEPLKSADSLVGASLVSGYNSHYVVVDSEGHIPDATKDEDQELFDEIVIQQEAQIVPVYVLRFDSQALKSFLEGWSGRDRDDKGDGRRDGGGKKKKKTGRKSREIKEKDSKS